MTVYWHNFILHKIIYDIYVFKLFYFLPFSMFYSMHHTLCAKMSFQLLYSLVIKITIYDMRNVINPNSLGPIYCY